jgi:diguanylate cyclase (GGDEF)-like protein/PAS domain S-box-containing protein
MNRITITSARSAQRMALWGFIYGLMFPLTGTLVECARTGQLTLAGVWEVQSSTPLLWILDLAPFVIGSMGFLITVPAVDFRSSRQSRLLPLWLLGLTMIPLSLLLYSLSQKYLADQYFSQINQAGWLRAQTLWVHGATEKKVPFDRRVAFRKLNLAREQLRERYPLEIASGDATWKEFKKQLWNTGRVNWSTANRVRLDLSSLSDVVEQKGRYQSTRAERLMLLGVLSMVFSLLLSFGILRRLRQTEIALHDAQERFTSFMNNSPAVAYMKDANGRYLYVNKAFEKHFDADESKWLGKTDHDLWPPELAGQMHDQDQAVLRRGIAQAKEQIAFSPDGSPRYWLSYTFPLKDSEGNYFVGGLSLEISERKRAEQKVTEQTRLLAEANSKLAQANNQLSQVNSQLESLAITDGLTGLKNRRAFMERLHEEHLRVLRHGTPLSLLLMDVDKFKQYNDSFGHPAGDEVLKAVAKMLADTARSIDIVARYGGEEFAVIMPNTNREGALTLAERFRHKIEKAPWRHRQVTASFGVATFWPTGGADALLQGANIETIISASDQALYEAKANGRNRVVHASPLPKEEKSP